MCQQSLMRLLRARNLWKDSGVGEMGEYWEWGTSDYLEMFGGIYCERSGRLVG